MLSLITHYSILKAHYSKASGKRETATLTTDSRLPNAIIVWALKITNEVCILRRIEACGLERLEFQNLS